MKKNWTLEVGFNTAPIEGGGGAPAVNVAEAPAASQPGAGAPPPASPSATPGGSGAAPRMYSSEEMSRTVQERLAREQEKYAPYKELGDPKTIRERLAKAERLEKALNGEGGDPHSPEERELRNLISKLGFVDAGKVTDVDKRMEALERMEQQRHVQAGSAQIGSLASEKFGELDEASRALVEQAVTASIGSDKEAIQAFFGGDREKVVAEHFNKVFEKQFDPLLRRAAAKYSSGKATDKTQVPPPTPKGGVQAPVTQERKLSGEERREQAWNRLQELEGKA